MLVGYSVKIVLSFLDFLWEGEGRILENEMNFVWAGAEMLVLFVNNTHYSHSLLIISHVSLIVAEKDELFILLAKRCGCIAFN